MLARDGRGVVAPCRTRVGAPRTRTGPTSCTSRTGMRPRRTARAAVVDAERSAGERQAPSSASTPLEAAAPASAAQPPVAERAGSGAGASSLEAGAVAPASSSALQARRAAPLVQRPRGACDLVYLYDGAVCLALVSLLRSRRGGDSIYYEDLSSPSYDAAANAGVAKADALLTVTVLTPRSGAVTSGMAAITLLYEKVGLGWLMKLAALPGLKELAELAHKLVSKNRGALGAGWDSLAGGLLGLTRVSMEARGEGSCPEDGECRSAYADDGGGADAGGAAAVAPPAAVADAAAAAAGHAPAAVVSAAPPAAAAAAAPAAPSGSTLDTGTLLGVYYSYTERCLVGAVVDVATGALVTAPARAPVASTDVEALTDGVRSLVARFGWKGTVGLGLPGLLRHAAQPGGGADPTTAAGDDDDGDGDGDGAVDAAAPPPQPLLASLASSVAAEVAAGFLERRHCRAQAEVDMQDELERPVLVFTGAEAVGYAELAFGVLSPLPAPAPAPATAPPAPPAPRDGLVLVLTLGLKLGVALFDGGALVRNTQLADDLKASWLAWERDSPVPPLLLAAAASAAPPSRAVDAFCALFGPYLEKLDASFHPDAVVLAGAAGASAAAWAPRLQPRVRAALLPAALPAATAGVIGAAIGGARQLALRGDLARVRAAVGRAFRGSPALLSPPQLRAVFDSFDADASGALTGAEVAAAVAALGVPLPAVELRELLADMSAGGDDDDGAAAAEAPAGSQSGALVSYPAFARWWADAVASSPVTHLFSRSAYDLALAEEAASGRLLVLEVGFTYCRPCKRFEPAYKRFAHDFPQHRFFRLDGNLNSEMVRLGRDVLGVKTTPSFFFFRNGELVHRCAGAREDLFLEALKGAAAAPQPLPTLLP